MRGATTERIIYDRDLVAERDYWIEKLSRRNEASVLMADHPRSVHGSAAQTEINLSLEGQVYRELQRLTRERPFLIYAVLMTALKICLAKYTGGDGVIAVGSPSLKEPGREAQPANVLVILDRVESGTPFRDYLATVRQTLLEAYERQRYPFRRLLRDLGLEDSNGRSPLFDVALVMTDIHVPLPEVNNDITINWRIEPDRLGGHVRYVRALYERTTIERFIQHYLDILRRALANIDLLPGALAVLSQAERHHQLTEWNDTEAEYPTDIYAHGMFEAQAMQRPEAVAVVCGTEQVTYGELERAANRVAYKLREMNVGPEVLVGICVERSIEMIAAVLAVMKVGAAYLPLDPSYPSERLRFMVKDAEAGVVLTQERLSGMWADASVASVLYVDETGQRGGSSATDLELSVKVARGGANLAYVIYTSGSSGRPKGVMISYENLNSRIRSFIEAYEFDAADRLMQFITINFDASAEEIYPILACGATLVLPERGGVIPANEFLNECRRRNITVVHLPAAYWHEVVSELTRTGQAVPESVKLCIVGGESPSPEKLLTWKRLAPARARLINAYGPTEATITSTLCEISGEGVQAGELSGSLIGRPVANTQVQVLDERLEPVPIGVPGELYIGGTGLARGYLRLGEMTAERFLPEPFAASGGGGRVYRTGDLARLRGDGNIEFLGRRDHQIKLRGFRIELGEIEARLREYPGLDQAVVTLRGEEAGGEQLVAYFVMRDASTPTSLELGRFLLEKLPGYMLPAAFVRMPVLPLTPNGKIERDALPAPSASVAERGLDEEPPHNLTQELLVSIWSQVLGVENVGIHSNFIELGGHSLHAAQIMMRLAESFKVEVPLSQLFLSPTLAQLAEHIDEARRTGETVARIERASRDQLLPLSFAQQRFWFLAQVSPHSSAYNISSAIRMRGGPAFVVALEQSLSEIVRRHETLRTRFVSHPEGPAQVIDPAQLSALPVIDLSGLEQTQRQRQWRRLASEGVDRPFDLTREKTLRSHLILLAKTERLLTQTLHHINSDGWSVEVLRRELTVLHRAYLQGSPSPLPELPIQYADYAVWQRQRLQGSVLDGQLAYWKTRLDGAPPVLELPTDRPRPPVKSSRGGHRSLVLSENVSAALKALGRREGGTPFMVLLASFQVLLARYTGREDIVVGTPMAGRNRVEVEGLIGCFVNMLALRTDLSGDPSFRGFLGRVREGVLEAQVNQELPFEKLVEEIAPERSLSYTPLFQVAFVLQNTLMGSGPQRNLAELEKNGLGAEDRSAKYDLVLDVLESGERIVGTMKYDAALFDDNRIRRMLRHWQALLEGFTSDPEASIWEVPLLAEAERHHLLTEWNDTEAEYQTEIYPHGMFEAQAMQRPEAVAVVCGAEQLTYGELDRAANRVAYKLREMNVGPEVLVGICVERSIEMIAAVLAVMKVGAAYLPLDPSYPSERLRFMVKDAEAGVVLTQERLSGMWADGWARVLYVDDAGQRGGSSAAALELSVKVARGGANLAYVIYTSGSSGRPKGVMISYESLNGRIRSFIEAYEFDAADRLMQFITINFDASAEEIYPILACGATLVLPERGGVIPANEFLNECRRRNITVVHLPAAYWHEVVSELTRTGQVVPESVKLCIVGGESPSPEKLLTWKRLAPARARLINAYGPTEATITSTLCEISEVGVQAGELSGSLIGRPVANTQVQVLDERLEPVPIGVPGELYIGGTGLARGYLRLGEMTAERFLPEPFAASRGGGGRVYRTGDLARLRGDGNIEFLGRRDHQIKLRGFRIELGEIETAVRRYPGVTDAAVLVQDDGVGGRRLVAYVASEQGAALDTDELRRALRAQLPDYMVPGAIVPLAELPVTTNGKVDRRALRGLTSVRSGNESGYLAPSTEIERLIVNIWQRALKVERVGIHDNFFDMGGHSLLLVQVNQELQEALGRDLPVIDLFRYPTVGSLAEHLSLRTATEPPPREQEDVTEDDGEKLRAVMMRQRQLRSIHQAAADRESIQNELSQ